MSGKKYFLYNMIYTSHVLLRQLVEKRFESKREYKNDNGIFMLLTLRYSRTSWILIKLWISLESRTNNRRKRYNKNVVKRIKSQRTRNDLDSIGLTGAILYYIVQIRRSIYNFFEKYFTLSNNRYYEKINKIIPIISWNALWTLLSDILFFKFYA